MSPTSVYGLMVFALVEEQDQRCVFLFAKY